MTVSCSRCGQTWPRDPALEVACPDCLAPVGKWCKRPSGHAGRTFTDLHRERERLALAMGVMQRCPAAAVVPHAVQTSLF